MQHVELDARQRPLLTIYDNDPTQREEFQYDCCGLARHVAREATSAVGHADTARVFAAALERPVEANRVTVALARGERALVGQYVGPRLPEGATALPEGARIDWLLVTVE